jgi:phosphotriesterase-related protein
MASRLTGAPIVSHTTGGLGLEQLDLFEGEGLEPSSVLVSHVCGESEPVEYAVAIARRGAYVGLDRIGHSAHDISHWAGIVTRLIDEGLERNVILSHDSVQRFHGPEAIFRHVFRDPSFINREFLPELLRLGVSQETLRLVTRANPRRWLSREEAPS